MNETVTKAHIACTRCRCPRGAKTMPPFSCRVTSRQELRNGMTRRGEGKKSSSRAISTTPALRVTRERRLVEAAGVEALPVSTVVTALASGDARVPYPRLYPYARFDGSCHPAGRCCCAASESGYVDERARVFRVNVALLPSPPVARQPRGLRLDGPRFLIEPCGQRLFSPGVDKRRDQDLELRQR